ncbi:MAG: hypothetical protein WD942_10205 [Dehalococcoidia bacterium]
MHPVRTYALSIDGYGMLPIEKGLELLGRAEQLHREARLKELSVDELRLSLFYWDRSQKWGNMVAPTESDEALFEALFRELAGQLLDSGQPSMTRLADIQRFYDLLDELALRTGGPRSLSECTGRLEWPHRGVYFFFEPGELRSDSGNGPRMVRVGTHALKTGSRTSLWNRLSQHRGSKSTGSGNHRGSIFRLLIGAALIERGSLDLPTWGVGSSAPREVREPEKALEIEVSRTLGAMNVLWLPVDDEPGAASFRGIVERNAIALLSNASGSPLDASSDQWLGLDCPRTLVGSSGLWNQNHVNETYDRAFLDLLESHIANLKVNS